MLPLVPRREARYDEYPNHNGHTLRLDRMHEYYRLETIRGGVPVHMIYKGYDGSDNLKLHAISFPLAFLRAKLASDQGESYCN
jgi:hypothetical protein